MQYIPLALFGILYAGATLAWDVPALAAALYLALSLLCFGAYALDKSAAKAGRRRTPESTLLLLGLAGGWPGAVLAQQWLRHKSSKVSFRFKFWISVALNCAAFIYWAGAGRLGI
ncbi:MAG TPA: DUF1294 domain-containing protein [Janthinobacterium sp.]|nr:DUF1294 domain-containing protein [Janthinobacterium sp.]